MRGISADDYSAIGPFVTGASGEPEWSGSQRLDAVFVERDVFETF
jgi:hypothetical protein